MEEKNKKLGNSPSFLRWLLKDLWLRKPWLFWWILFWRRIFIVKPLRSHLRSCRSTATCTTVAVRSEWICTFNSHGVLRQRPLWHATSIAFDSKFSPVFSSPKMPRMARVAAAMMAEICWTISPVNPPILGICSLSVLSFYSPLLLPQIRWSNQAIKSGDQ